MKEEMEERGEKYGEDDKGGRASERNKIRPIKWREGREATDHFPGVGVTDQLLWRLPPPRPPPPCLRNKCVVC